MADPAVVLNERFAAAVREAFGVDADPVLRPSAQERFGDFQANGAMALGKQLGKPPREVAEAIVAKVDLRGVASKTEIAGPGFVNIWLEDAFVTACLDDIDVPNVASPETYVIDYSHPNVAKEMHVGHLRSTIIGDTLARIFEAQGHRVVRHNHIGDWGTPFGMLIEHLLDIGETEAADELSVGDLTTFYQAARVKFDADTTFADRARQRVVSLQAGDEETLRLWHLLVAESERYFDAVYDRLGVTLTPADIKGESAYNDMLDGVAAALETAGLARIDNGALCAFPPGFEIPLIVRKSDEGYGYQATDLAAIRHRVSDVGGDHLLYVVDGGQHLHLVMAFAVAEQAGWLKPGQAEHIQFGLVLGPDGKKLATRAGKAVKLIELLDEAVERAAAVVASKSPDLPTEEAAALAKAVGIGAVKYADLSSDRVKDYLFDFDRMLAWTATPPRTCSTPEPVSVPSNAGPRPRLAPLPDRSPSARRPNEPWRCNWRPSLPRSPLRPSSASLIVSPAICSSWPRRSRRSTRAVRY